jgi:hypothetical protein
MFFTPPKFSEPSEWSMSVTACIDESGKKDHKVISLGCVGGFTERFDRGFSEKWQSLLQLNGLKEVSGKHVLRHTYPLSKKNPCLGVQSRTAALLPFIHCIRDHLQMICGVAFDAESYRQLPPKFLERFGSDPAFMAFVRLIMCIAEFTPPSDISALVCDDEEVTAWPFYQFYRKVRKVWPPAQKSLRGISFVDDRYFYGVQASDLVASLVRYEATSQMKNAPYDYQPLYNALVADPERHERYLYSIGIIIATKENLLSLASLTLEQQKKDVKEHEEEIRRVRELRPNNASTNERATQRDKGRSGRRKSGQVQEKAKS